MRDKTVERMQFVCWCEYNREKNGVLLSWPSSLEQTLPQHMVGVLLVWTTSHSEVGQTCRGFMYTAITQLFTSTPFLYWCKIQYDFTLFCSLHIFITRSTEQQTRTKIKHKRDRFLRPAHTFRKASLSPWFSDNCYILFKVEALRGLKKKKTRGLANLCKST